MPKVSIILTSYNHAAYLKASIDSVLGQTFEDWEMHIIDDASSDESWEIIEGYSDPRIIKKRLPQNTNCAYLEDAVKTCRGEYIAIAHSDDMWLPSKISEQVAYLDGHPDVQACFTQVIIIDENDKILKKGEHPFAAIFDQENRSRLAWLREFYDKGNCLCHPSVLIRKYAYEKYQLFSKGLSSVPDFYHWVKLASHANLYILEKDLVCFRANRDTNTSAVTEQNIWKHMAERYLAILPLYRELTKQDFLEVFPEAKQYDLPEGYVQDFAYAQILLANKEPDYQLFGLKLLYDLFQTPFAAQSIDHLYQYTLQKYTADKRRFRIFNVPEIPGLYSTLFFDYGDGYGSADSISKKVLKTDGCYEVEFILPVQDKPVQGLRFDPDEGTYRRYLQITAWDQEGRELTVCPINGMLQNGEFWFYTSDPQCEIAILNDTTAITIKMQCAEDFTNALQEKMQELYATRTQMTLQCEKKEKELLEAKKQLGIAKDELLKYHEVLVATQQSLINTEVHLHQVEETHRKVTESFFWKITWPARAGISLVKKCLKTCPGSRTVYWILSCIKNQGFKATWKICQQRFYMRKNFPGRVLPAEYFASADFLIAQKQDLIEGPTISILVPLYNTPLHYLKEMMDSVRNQTYTNWELCLANAGLPAECEQYIHRVSAKDKRIKCKKLLQNQGISENTNAAMEVATGSYFALLDHDDVLHPSALHYVVEAIGVGADFIYSDELTFKENINQVVNYAFKPDFAPDMLRSCNYICHLSTFSAELLRKAGGGFRSEYDGSQDYDMVLRLTEQAEKIVHIPFALYFWRASETSVANDISAKQYCIDSAICALQDHLTRKNLSGQVSLIPGTPGFYRIRYELTGTPKISILIPTCDHVEDLKQCIDSIVSRSTYSNYEILIIENNSTDPETFCYYEELSQKTNIRVLYYPEHESFNYSRLNNFAAREARGQILLLLNNDVEVITENWLEEMLMFVQRPDVGAAGAMLYYPDNTIQHAGIGIGIGGVAGHLHKYFDAQEHGYMGRLHYAQNVGGVTGACLMIRKDVFEQLHGLDESFAVAFNDVDLCMRIRKAGYFIVFTPYAQLYHYESKSRGSDNEGEKKKRFHKEIEHFFSRWNQDSLVDPYMNPNISTKTESLEIDVQPMPVRWMQ